MNVTVAWSMPTTYTDGSLISDPDQSLSYQVFVAPMGVKGQLWQMVWEGPGTIANSCTNAGNDYCVYITDISVPKRTTGFRAYVKSYLTMSPTSLSDGSRAKAKHHDRKFSVSPHYPTVGTTNVVGNN